jgi:hypothetical protein
VTAAWAKAARTEAAANPATRCSHGWTAVALGALRIRNIS